MMIVLRVILLGALLALSINIGLRAGTEFAVLEERVNRLEHVVNLLDSRDRYQGACDAVGLIDGDLAPEVWWSIGKEKAVCVYEDSGVVGGVVVVEEEELSVIKDQLLLNLKENRSL